MKFQRIQSLFRCRFWILLGILGTLPLWAETKAEAAPNITVGALRKMPHFLRAFVSPSFHWWSIAGALAPKPAVRFAAKAGLLYDIPLLPYFYGQTGLFYHYVNDRFLPQNGYQISYTLSGHQIVGDEAGTLVHLRERTLHTQYLGWPLGIKVISPDWGVWNLFLELGLQNLFLLKASAEDKVQFEDAVGNLSPTSYLHDLNVDSFWEKYSLEWYMHIGVSFSLLKRLDAFTSLGYYGGFFNIYKDGRFALNPNSRVSLSSNGIELRLGVAYRFGTPNLKM